MKKLLRFLGISIIFTAFACVDVYDPKLTGQTPQLVFEGTLTDEIGPYFFNLSNTAGYNSKESVFDKFVNAAKVWIVDAKKVRTDLLDLNKGKFRTPDGFRGQVGNTYTLHILNAGVEYVSNAETMRYSSPIEKIYSEYVATTAFGSKHRGFFNVYLDTKDPATEGDFYSWKWFNYTKTKICDLYTPPGSIFPVQRPCCEDCWNINQCIGCITVASDNLVNGKALIKQNIAQVPYYETTPYYMLIKQMSLSRDAYNYWLSVDAQANNSGGIFDTAPGTIRGNIKNLSDEQQPMLGFFQVSAVTKKIFYLQRNTVPYPPFSIVPLGGFWPICTNCQESPYRTAIRPENWVD
jgi:hypothetical protein